MINNYINPEISISDFNKYVEIFNYERIKFIFEFITNNIDNIEFDNYTKRWLSNLEILNKISEDLRINNEHWYEIFKKNHINNFETFKIKDLCGLKLKDFHFKSNNRTIFYSTFFEYSIIENCVFENIFFFENKFKCTLFIDTIFNNCIFKCSITNSVFINCKFNNTIISQNLNDTFCKVIFAFCDLSINISKINPEEFVFIECSNFNLKISELTKWDYKNSGKTLLKEFKNNLDNELYIKVKHDIYSNFNIYYIELSNIFKNKSLTNEYLKSYFAYRLFDEIKNEHYFKKLTYYISRYIFGFGVNWKSPLILLFFIILNSSVLIMFIGIEIDNTVINRDLIFDNKEFFNTIKDFLKCFSIVLNNSFKLELDFKNNSILINMLSNFISFSNFFLLTIFTFNLTKKYN